MIGYTSVVTIPIRFDSARYEVEETVDASGDGGWKGGDIESNWFNVYRSW